MLKMHRLCIAIPFLFSAYVYLFIPFLYICKSNDIHKKDHSNNIQNNPNLDIIFIDHKWINKL